jgi:hypothetical protein
MTLLLYHKTLRLNMASDRLESSADKVEVTSRASDTIAAGSSETFKSGVSALATIVPGKRL